MKDNFEVVDQIERIRLGANNMGNTDKKFLHSLDSVINDLRSDYLNNKGIAASVGKSRPSSRSEAESVRDSIDDLKDQASRHSEMRQTRDSV